MTDSIKHWRRFWFYAWHAKFKVYFFTLLLVLFITPLPTPKLIDSSLIWLLLLFFTLSPYFLNPRRVLLLIPAIFFSSLVLRSVIHPESLKGALQIGLMMLNVTLYFLVMFHILIQTVRHEVVSEDMIYGGLSGYLMMGVGFAYVFEVMQELGLASFYVDGLLTPEMLDNDDLIYFSFSCLTTLGIGDIVPVTPIARRLGVIESVVGVLYVAVFIGRLVGRSLSRSLHDSSK